MTARLNFVGTFGEQQMAAGEFLENGAMNRDAMMRWSDRFSYAG
jgi:hypothetical protein